MRYMFLDFLYDEVENVIVGLILWDTLYCEETYAFFDDYE